MKIKIGDRVYDAAALNELSLKMILQLEGQMADFGRPMQWHQIEQAIAEITAMKTDDERARHPDGIWITAVTIWATRKSAGEDVTFDQAVDFPLSQLSYVRDPQDRANPQKPRSPKGSGAAGKRPAKSNAKTSKTASISV